MSIGGTIKEARKKKGYTQKQLADMIGAKHNSVSDWENNKNKPDIDTLERICDVLDLLPNDFFEDVSIDDNSEIISRIMKNQDDIKMISEYYSLKREDQKAVRQIISSLSKKE